MRNILLSSAAIFVLSVSGVAWAQTGPERSAEPPAGSAHKGEPSTPKISGENGPERTTREPRAESPSAAPNKDAERSADEKGAAASEKRHGETAEKPAAADRKSAESQHGSDTQRDAERHDDKAKPAKNKATDERTGEHGAAKDARGPSDPASTARDEKSNDKNPAGAHSAENREGTPERTHLDSRKQTRISETIRNQHVTEVTDVDFNIRAGRVVPEHHHLYPLPEEVISILPQYRDYEYIVADEDIVIVDPHTRKIVYTMAEGRSSGMNRAARDCD